MDDAKQGKTMRFSAASTDAQDTRLAADVGGDVGGDVADGRRVHVSVGGRGGGSWWLADVVESKAVTLSLQNAVFGCRRGQL